MSHTVDANTKLLVQHNGFNAQSKAIFFDGSGDYLTTPDHADWDLGAAGSGDFTIECWVRFRTIKDSHGLVNHYDVSNVGWYTRVDASSGLIGIWTGPATYRTVSASFVAGKWYHIAYVRSGSTITIYQNGKSKGTVADGSMNGGLTADLRIGTENAGVNSMLDGWIKQVRISNSARYTSDFTPSTTQFADDANTKLLILAEETNGATTFTDSEGTPKTITTNGNCVLQYTSDYRESNFIDTETTPKLITDFGDAKILSQAFNKSAGFFTGEANNFVQIPDSPDFTFGSGDMTAECWVMWTNTPSTYKGIMGHYESGSTHWYIYYDGTNIRFRHYESSSITIDISQAFSPQQNTWYHLAIVKNGTDFFWFINGIKGSTQSDVTPIRDMSGVFMVGANVNAGGTLADNFAGWMKEVRLSNTARYTATFTPSTTQFTTDSNTKLLLHFDTPATAPLAPAIKFDGTGDYLTVPDSVDWDFGAAGDFTLETWVRFRVIQDSYLISRTDGATNNFCDIVWSTSAGVWRFYIGNTIAVTGSGTPIANRWYHIAAVRKNGVATIYLDGVNIGSAASTHDVLSTNNYRFGTLNGSVNNLDGWMKNIRISRVARYAAPFTPTQSGFTSDSDTLLLLKGDENNGATTFVDSSSFARTVTTNGDTKISYEEDYRTNVFKDSSVTDDTALTSAVKFDGTGDWLDLADHADWDFGTGDFTFEGHFRFGAAATYYFLIARNTANYFDITYNGTSFNVFLMGPNVYSQAYTNVANRWYHVAVSRSGTNLRVFIDGVQLGATVTNSTNISATDPIRIGAAASGTQAYNGWMRNVRISNSARYTANFTPTAVSTDLTDDANTKLLITGSITGGTGQSKAIRFDGTNDFLSLADHVDWDIDASGLYTAEAWVRWNTVGDQYIMGQQYHSGLTGGGWAVLYNGTNWIVDIQNSTVISVAASPVAHRWYHVAFVRSATTAYLFVDGVLLSSVANTAATSSTEQLKIGTQPSDGAKDWNGWMKQIRITKGVARYTAAFTPSETLFADDGNTVLLISAEESVGATTFVDSHTTPKTVTTNGDCIIQQTPDYRNRVIIDREATPKTITTVADAVIENQVGIESKHAYPVVSQKAKVDFLSVFGTGAAVFDGTGDNLNIPTSSDWNFGTGDWTLEGWVRFNANGSTTALITVQGTAAGIALAVNDIGGVAGFHIYVVGTEYYTSHAYDRLLYTWYHFAGVRSGNNLYFWINGTKNGNTEDVTGKNITGNTLGVYIASVTAGANYLTALVDNVQISNVARYTATFNPPDHDFTFGAQGNFGSLLALL